MGVEVQIRNLSRRYGSGPETTTVALDGVSFRVTAESAVAITGPSGSGKSTLLHIVGAMDRADAGMVRVGDHEVTALHPRQQAAYRRTIGFVFQRFHLLPALTALDNVLAPVLPRATNFNKTSRGLDLLRAVGLEGKDGSLPSQLSGGEQQRVAIARALVNDPSLLLTDEPTGNLDSASGSEVIQLILDLRARRGMTVLVATHNPVIATRCDRIVRLQDGSVIDELEVSAGSGTEDVLDRITRLGPGA
jgi:putative ABC transport system ATP-binding protein